MHGPRSPWENFTLTVQTFEAFGFAEPLSRALTQCGYATPTPIQVQALPPQLEGRDLLGMAETGSGKTATFVLPILHKIAAESIDPAPKQVLALILAPTRELAIQIDQEVASLSRNMRVRRAVVLGGVSKGPQINALKRGVHVLVATPGRLLDHVTMRTCDLSRVQILVLDEADRMFVMGFIRDITKIVALIPTARRTALFSATMPNEIKTFANDILNDPFRVDLSTKSVVVDRIDQKVMIVRTPEKQSRLHTILANPECKRVIVFTRTKRGADRVADRLGMASISAAAFHGNKAQNARQRALNDFTMGHIRVLVATDIAARGIDVSNITHVVNFDMPLDPETYVHRVGRTARKGTSGIAISLCDPSERQEITAIERLMKQKIEIIDDVGGEVLPMPARRPHHQASHASRRDGGNRGEQRRDGGHRGEDRNDRHGRSNGHHRNGDRQHDHAARPHTGGRHGPNRDVASEIDAVFGVESRPERPSQDRRPHRGPSGNGHRSDRPRHERGGNEQRAQGHRHPREDRPDRSREDRPARHADQSRPEHAHAGRRQENARAPQRRNGDQSGDRRPAWSGGADAPKFMKRRDNGRGRPSRPSDSAS
jgi:ATP-dependent RNA helicase RhlE